MQCVQGFLPSHLIFFLLHSSQARVTRRRFCWALEPPGPEDVDAGLISSGSGFMWSSKESFDESSAAASWSMLGGDVSPGFGGSTGSGTDAISEGGVRARVQDAKMEAIWGWDLLT